MAEEITDSELRIFLEGESTVEEEERIVSLLDESAVLRQRLELISGASEFERHMDPGSVSGWVTAPTPELREVIERVLTPSPEATSVDSLESAFIAQLAPTENPKLLGSLGHYEISEIIAAGGMGVVYRARDPELERTVAIKMLSPAFAGSEDAKERFHREAKAAAAIEHPNVIPIHAVDRSIAPLPFLVMRFVDGESLSQRMHAHEGEPMPLEELLRIARGIAAGLAAAHARGLIHRDIKPSNIMLEQDGPGIWITDFGLARAGSDSGITQPNTFIGTPEFASPEHARGRNVEHRSDLFSFGSVLYLMGTGHRPFSGDDFASLVYQIVHEPHTPARQANPKLPPWLATLIDGLLEKDRRNRIGPAEEVLRCLESESVASADRSRPVKSLLAGAIALALVVGAIFYLARPRDPNPSTDMLLPITETPTTPLHFTVASGSNTSGHATLEAAIEAAEDGASITVTGSGVLTTDTITIPKGKFLTIRAARDHRPTLAAKTASPLIITESPLILEGVTLEQSVAPHTLEAAIIHSTSASLCLANCRLLRHTDKESMAIQTMPPPFIVLNGFSTLRITNCEVYAPDTNAIRLEGEWLRSAGSVHIENSIFMAMSCLMLRSPLPQPVSVELSENAVLSKRFLALLRVRTGNPQKQPARYSIKAEGNVLAGTNFCIMSNNVTGKDAVEMLDWQSRGNLYDFPMDSFVAIGKNAAARTQVEKHYAWGASEPEGILMPLPGLRRLFDSAGERDLATLAPADFAVEMKEAKEPASSPGPDLRMVGPGEPFDQWRDSDAAKSWMAETQAACLSP